MLFRSDTLEEQSRARRNGKLGLDARYGDYLGFVRGKLTEAREVVAEHYQRREEVRNELEEMLKACKLLEKYRDRLKEDFCEELTREEQKVLDMHSIYKHLQDEEAGEEALR